MKRILYDLIAIILLSAVFLMTLYALIPPEPIVQPAPQIAHEKKELSYWDKMHEEVNQHVEEELAKGDE